MTTQATPLRRRAATSPHICPECRQPVPPPPAAQGGDGGEPAVQIRVCWSCAAIYAAGPAGGPRLLMTPEWIAICCHPGHAQLWDERDLAVKAIAEKREESRHD